MADTLSARLAKLDSCALSDALDRLGLSGAVLGLRPLWACPRLSGPVVTVKLRPASPGEQSPRHLGTAAIESASAGDVIVVDAGGAVHAGSWGGILSLAAHSRGVAGVVTDGACRDVDEARELGFPVYGRDGVAFTARGRLVEEAFNGPIQVGGQEVRPGDLVLADWSGVVFVSRGQAEQVLAAAEQIAAREAAMAADIRAGQPVSQVMGTNYERMLTSET